MAIQLEFCNVIVPVEKIREKLGNGVFESRFSLITDTTWHDGLLFREGCMTHIDLDAMLDEWEKNGLALVAQVKGEKHWVDLCVVNSGHGPSYPCEWIEYDPAKNIVWLKGHAPGVAIGPAGRTLATEN
ncbi:MAG: hypothetical protein A3G27_16980 [Betaproteobacteria bacterium RIFCSPLOWO2_12_FULL_66_14]|nr:MAG: hypothetical protein A3G27_16980 [Betaproteobacteria bacterium RIFCSPLOWO2_12_FULL_66_14]